MMVHRAVLFGLAAAPCSVGAGGDPTVFWVSEPLRPGDTAVVAFASPGKAAAPAVLYARQNSSDLSGADSHPNGWTVLNTSGPTAYGIAALIPSTFVAGEFEVKVGVGGTPYIANAARPWFIFGDAGTHSTPGGYVRVVGDAVALQSEDGALTASHLHIQVAGKEVAIAARSGSTPGAPPGSSPSRSHAFFDLPASIAPGVYPVAVSNSATGSKTPLCTFLDPTTPCLSTVNITAASGWAPFKTDTFTVNATQPGVGHDATAAVAAAVSAANANGGGTVFFPTGQYFIKGPLIVDPGVVLKGASRELVAIYFHEDNQTTAPAAYITSSKPGSWGLEDLTFYITAFANDIVRFQPGTDGAFLRRSRIRFNSYFCLEPVQGGGSRGRNTAWPHSVGTAVKMAGTNLFITDNDIYSSGDVVSTLNNGAAGASYLHIARNQLWNGGTTHWGISWKQSIYEDNVAIGASTTAMGSNYPQYAHNDGAPHVQNIYHHNNSQTMVWGNDREMMTSDAGGGVYAGMVKPQSADAPLRIELAESATGTQPGGALCVLSGTCTGECRRVTNSSSTDGNAPMVPQTCHGHGCGSQDVFTIDRPFTYPLDDTSHITILPFTGQIAFNANDYSDGGEVQFYSTALGVQAVGNRFSRTGGLTLWARIGATCGTRVCGWGANFRNSLIDNEAVEGNHVWNYNTKPTSATDPAMADYFPGGSKTIEPWFFGSLTNDQGEPVDPSPPVDADLALNRFIVLRGNKVHSNGGIVVRGTSANVLVEGSMIEHSHVGIYVNKSTTKGGIVLVNNKEPKGVPENYNPYVVAQKAPGENGHVA